MEQVLELAQNNWDQIQDKFKGLKVDDQEEMIDHFNSFDGEQSLGNALFGDDPDFDEFRDSVMQLDNEKQNKFAKHWNDAFEEEEEMQVKVPGENN